MKEEGRARQEYGIHLSGWSSPFLCWMNEGDDDEGDDDERKKKGGGCKYV